MTNKELEIIMPFLEIHLKNRVDPAWSDWLQGMEVELISPQETYLSGEMPDHSAIYGILSSIATMGLMFTSVTVTESDQYIPQPKHLST